MFISNRILKLAASTKILKRGSRCDISKKVTEYKTTVEEKKKKSHAREGEVSTWNFLNESPRGQAAMDEVK